MRVALVLLLFYVPLSVFCFLEETSTNFPLGKTSTNFLLELTKTGSEFACQCPMCSFLVVHLLEKAKSKNNLQPKKKKKERTKEKTKEKYKEGYASNLLHLSTIRGWKFSAGWRDPFEELEVVLLHKALSISLSSIVWLEILWAQKALFFQALQCWAKNGPGPHKRPLRKVTF